MTETPLKDLSIDKIDFTDPDINYTPKKINLIIPPKNNKKEQPEKKEDFLKKIEEPLVNLSSTSILSNSKEQKVNFEDININQSIRLTELPRHDDDFASKWFYGSRNEVETQRIIIEFNAHNQVLDELREEKLELPKDFKGKQIAYDIDTFVYKDFTKKGVVLNTKDNLIHRAFYSHCVQRALESIRQGEFTTPEGYTVRKPEIADIIERRINEIIINELVHKEEN